MATFFQRVIGEIGPDEERITIHAIKAMFGEIIRGEMSPGDIVTSFELSTEQQLGLNVFLTKISQHPDKIYIGMVIFDWLALADRGIMPEKYRNEVTFLARLDDEISKATTP